MQYIILALIERLHFNRLSDQHENIKKEQLYVTLFKLLDIINDIVFCNDMVFAVT